MSKVYKRSVNPHFSRLYIKFIQSSYLTLTALAGICCPMAIKHKSKVAGNVIYGKLISSSPRMYTYTTVRPTGLISCKNDVSTSNCTITSTATAWFFNSGTNGYIYSFPTNGQVFPQVNYISNPYGNCIYK